MEPSVSLSIHRLAGYEIPGAKAAERLASVGALGRRAGMPGVARLLTTLVAGHESFPFAFLSDDAMRWRCHGRAPHEEGICRADGGRDLGFSVEIVGRGAGLRR